MFKSRTIEILQTVFLLLILLTLFFNHALIGGRALVPADLIFDIDPLWQPLAPSGFEFPGNALLQDQVYQFYPWKAYMWRSFDKNELPLWNPYIHCGQNFVGNTQSGIFDPFTILSRLFPFHYTFIFTAGLHLFIAGLFTFLFTRDIGLGKGGSLFSMIVFIFSTPMVVWLGYALGAVIIWLPLLLWSTGRMLARKSPYYFALTAFIIAAQFLGGHPETSFLIILMWIIFSIFHVISLKKSDNIPVRANLLRIAGLLLIGILLAAHQLLPFLETLLNSHILSERLHDTGLNLAKIIRQSFFSWRDWPAMITIFLPQFFGTPLNRTYWYPYTNYNEQNAYAGILPLVLAIAAMFWYLNNRYSKHRSQVLFWGAFAVFSAGVAFRLPLISLINELPIFNISITGRFRLLYVFALSILAGFGLEKLIRSDKKQEKMILQLLFFVGLISLVLIGTAYGGMNYFKEELIEFSRARVEARQGTPTFVYPLEYYYRFIEERHARRISLFHPSNVVMYLPFLIALFYGAWYRWHHKLKLNNKVWLSLFFILTIADLMLVNISYNPTTSVEQIYPTPGAIQFLKRDHDLYRVVAIDSILNPNSNMVFEISDIRGYENMVSRRYIELMSRLKGHVLVDYHSLFMNAASPLLDLLNIKYVITDKALSGKWKKVYEDPGRIKIYENQKVMTRAFIVYDFEVTDNEKAALLKVTDPGFNFRNAVVLDESPPDWTVRQRVPSDPPEIEVIEYGPNHIDFEFSHKFQGIFVLTDTYDTGWRAFLDGTQIPIYKANYVFRGVVVPPGRHRLEFTYEPMSFWIGIRISLVTTAILFMLIIFSMIKTRLLKNSVRLPLVDASRTFFLVSTPEIRKIFKKISQVL